MTHCRMLVLTAAVLAFGTQTPFAAAPTGLDASPTALAPAAPVSSSGPAVLGVETPAAAARERPRGNPLWGVPLSVLTATRERPIFLPSRRPIAPVIAAPQVAPPAAVTAPPPPERPRFALVGAIATQDENESIAVIVDQGTNTVIRLRMGQKHGDWVLSAVQGRSATLRKGAETLMLQLPAPGAATARIPVAGPAAAPVIPASVVPPGSSAAAATAESPPEAGMPGAGPLVVPDPGMGAPYIPRSSPKNGEHDGL
jgi:general secretion pathway protein N